MKRIWLSIIAILQISIALSAPQSSNSEPVSVERCREMSREIMRQIGAGNDRGALDLVGAELPIEKSKFDALRDATLEQRKSFAARYGKVVGFELVREEQVSDFLIRLTYVEKRANNLLRWQFTFYRATADWKLNAFKWDDDVTKLFVPGS